MATYHPGTHVFDAVSIAGAQNAGLHMFGSKSYMDLASASFNAWTLSNVSTNVTCDGNGSSAATAMQLLSALIRELIRKGILHGN